MDIAIVGTGYVGLVTGACFSERGHSVSCIDIDVKKVEHLRSGRIPIYEPGLDKIVKRNMKRGRLKFTSDYQVAIPDAAACFIAVPTPSNTDGSCNLCYIEAAASQIAEHMNGYLVLVNKSTVPVGTADAVKKIVSDCLAKRGTQISFDVVSNPEFLKEGAAIRDCLFPDRIIIGSDIPFAIQVLKEIYAPFFSKPDSEKMLVMDTRSAEMTKYAANAMLATRISFMNEMADICKKLGANIDEVRWGIGTDPRIGPNFLYPGVGYGGSCFPKDIRALIAIAKDVGSDPALLQAADHVNERQKKLLADEIETYFSNRGGIGEKTIAIWGLSFKPDTDDMREAPSLTIIQQLLSRGTNLRLFDPIAMDNAKKLIGEHPRVAWCSSESDAASGADAIALVTEWKQFRLIDFSKIGKEMKRMALFDGRNQYKSKIMNHLGFDYISIGTPDVLQKN
ncbi:MAG TPA: UDP-glucose/GDP-mannose dehydrogenase family protein [Chlamydiales bacterium]|nr:UDP-glucose/GDP-mannose dehydrogenase family protein [Chlamydiales bacterium]